MATNAEHKLLVNLNMNGQVIKDFRVDVVNNLPSTGEDGRLVYRTTSPIGLYIMKSTGWTLIEDAGKVLTSGTDTQPEFLRGAITVEGLDIGTYTVPGTSKEFLTLKNTFNKILAMEDVKWSPPPGSDALLGYSTALKKFVPLIINSSLEITTTGSTTNPTISIGVRKLSIHHTWNILGNIEKRLYLGYFSPKGIESIITKGFSARCRVGSCMVELRANGTPLSFNEGGTTKSRITVGTTAKQLEVTSNYIITNGAYIDMNISYVSDPCEDLTVTLWLLQD